MRAVIFDLDGVVVDTAKYHYLAWRKLAAELGFVFDEANNERLKGVSRMTSLEIVLETGKIQNLSMEEKIALADRKNGYYLDMVSTIDESEILPGIPAFLERLRAEWWTETWWNVQNRTPRCLQRRLKCWVYLVKTVW